MSPEPSDDSWLPSHQAMAIQERELILSSARGLAREARLIQRRVGVVIADLRGHFGVELARVHDVADAIVHTKVARSAQRGRLPVMVVPVDKAGLVVLLADFAPDYVAKVIAHGISGVAIFAIDQHDHPGLAHWPVRLFEMMLS